MPSPSKTDSLLEPFELRDLKLSNRVVLAPLTRARAGEDRVPVQMMAEYYAQRAGAGLIITEATTVSAQGNGWVNSPGIYTDEQAEGWRPVVDALRECGTPVFLQLWHTGRASHPDFHDGELPVAPSAVKPEGEAQTPKGKKAYVTPRALETEEIAPIVQDYVAAATRARAVGFDGIEIHAANGYLLDQFLQSKTNHREDQYGGSIENRFRLLDEIVASVCAIYPSERVGVRISPNGAFNDMGSPDYREQFTYVIEQLDGRNLAYLHAIDGLAFGFHELGDPMTLEEMRKLYRGPLMGNCGYDRHDADRAIDAGHADLIAFGRPYIANPDLVERFRNGWDLAPESDPKTWYGGGAEGYTDFPTYEEQQ